MINKRVRVRVSLGWHHVAYTWVIRSVIFVDIFNAGMWSCIRIICVRKSLLTQGLNHLCLTLYRRQHPVRNLRLVDGVSNTISNIQSSSWRQNH